MSCHLLTVTNTICVIYLLTNNYYYLLCIMINDIDISYKVYGLGVVSDARMHRKKKEWKQLVLIHDEPET